MGKANKSLKEFINNIPDSVLEALPTAPGKMYSDTNFRLDMQGMTTAGEHNLQVQVNNQTTISTLKKHAPKTVAGPVLVPKGNTTDAATIRASLLNELLI
ncbi:hypothetical protein PFICI_02934 [Pestalotiopsis fici W106-1]|uniref:Uncharacterized protein n=1 Tax=Pestalotiopsis fici (strain W106-1 / CGMCC3.15140) TaxID=1229662 RepID=W3XFX6_PESFW|nr:uncharacterized protein PFICI_02934 [Pestalotiopsis fici W106-1]ETS84909.1 hypothetical protein PFICI_02934 [Pestalotiopsis fici W106-1]